MNMKNIFKVSLLVCMLSVLICSTCFAYEKVQLNDTLGAGAIRNEYNNIIAGTRIESLRAEDFHYVGPRGDYEIYASVISDKNLIEYICNKAGYVDGIAIVSPSQEINSAEAFVMLAVVTNKYDVKACDAIARKSTSQYKPWNWYCEGTNRTYHINTTDYNGLPSTLISAFVQ